MVQKVRRVKIEDILMAHNCMKDIVIKTPLQRDTVLSEKYDCDVYVKREDFTINSLFQNSWCIQFDSKFTERKVTKRCCLCKCW